MASGPTLRGWESLGHIRSQLTEGNREEAERRQERWNIWTYALEKCPRNISVALGWGWHCTGKLKTERGLRFLKIEPFPLLLRVSKLRFKRYVRHSSYQIPARQWPFHSLKQASWAWRGGREGREASKVQQALLRDRVDFVCCCKPEPEEQ